MGALTYLFVAIVAITAAVFGPAVQRFVIVTGVFRIPANTFVSPADTVLIDDTVHCEDLHHHLESNLLFAACEDVKETRFGWFPGLTKLHAPEVVNNARGSIHVIDPQKFTSKRLEFENFEGPFVTHGIDVITDPEDAQSVYIHAINHTPHPDYLAHCTKRKRSKDAGETYPEDQPKVRSQVDIFHHILGSPTARHVRSVWHPLLKTPNDLVATSPTSFFVTNDHYYVEGHMRDIEDLWRNAKWSNIIYVELGNLDAVSDSSQGVTASVALTGLHNNNGLGRGRTADEIAIGSAVGATLYLGKIVNGNKIEVFDSVGLDSCIDNPSYYRDPYVSDDSEDRSAFVLAGLSRGVDLKKTCQDPNGLDPVMVWLAKPSSEGTGESAGVAAPWTRELLFEDDGTRIRTASAAGLVGIDPKKENGEKKAWLFTTGFMSNSILAVKIPI